MTPLKIFSDVHLSPSALQLLQEGVAPHQVIFPARPPASVLAKSEFDPAFLEADIAFGQPDLSSIAQSEKLRWVHLTSAGYTRYDTAEFRASAAARGLLVTNSSSVFAVPCAEHVFTFMLAQSRRLPLSLRSRFGSGDPEWYLLRNASTSLRGQNVLILGYGAIATKLIEMLRPFDAQIVALRRRARGDEAVPIATYEGLPEALANADHIVNILPANADSEGFISAERLASMKRGAVLYNIGRGTTVDQDALLAALRSGQLAAAWLDVTEPEPLPADHPLLAEPNCFITPHVAGGHADETETIVRHFLANFRRFVAETPLVDRIF
jgi:phosphoglycerate dehydrogenase-like enzyme